VVTAGNTAYCLIELLDGERHFNESNVGCSRLNLTGEDLSYLGTFACIHTGDKTVTARAIAGRHGLHALIAPVRPSRKQRCPLVAIEQYARWRRSDGRLFDPWLRVHERLGATVLKPEPRSLRITGTLAEWEDWTSMTFPEPMRASRPAA
jgi:hypothetical protein